MADEQNLVNRIDFDVGPAISAIEKLEKTLESYNQTVENLAKAERVLNQNGDVTAVTLQFINKEAEKLTATIHAVDEQCDIYNTHLKQSVDVTKRTAAAIREQETDYKKLAKTLNTANQALSRLAQGQADLQKQTSAANQAARAQSALFGLARDQAGSKRAVISAEEAKSVNAVVGDIVRNIQRGDFTLKEFEASFVSLQKNGTASLLGLSKGLTDAVVKFNTSIEKIGSSDTKELQERVQAARLRAEQKHNEELENLRKQVLAARLLAEQQNAEKILNLQNAVRTASLLAEQQHNEKLEATRNRVRSASALAEQSAAERSQALRDRVQSAAALAEQEYGEKLKNLRDRINSAAALAEQQHNEKMESIRNRVQSARLLEEQKYAEQLQALRNRVLAARLLAEQRAEEASAARNRARANAVLGNLRQAPANLSLDQLVRADQLIDQINQSFEQGRATIADYLRVQNAIARGTVSQLTPAQRQLAQQLIALQQAYRGVGQTGVAAGNGILNQWRFIVRLFAVQQIHKAISLISFSMQNAVRTSIEYGQRIAEIQTISLEANRSFESWSTEVRRLSDSFGADAAVTAKAAYEALSNQVIQGADSYKFLNEALQFSIIAVTSAENSVNLLSSAINAFGKKTSDAGDLSAKFFKAIDLGRFTADELANTYGRVATTANALGVTNEELLATLTVLTRQGVDVDEAMTLIGNVMLKLIKPTEEMQGLLNGLGVASGQAAVGAFGLEGILGRLNEESKKGVQRTGELLNEFRALRGGIGLSGEAFKEFQKDLQAIKNTSRDDGQRAFLTVMENDSKKLQVELTKLKNFFTVELGQKMVKAISYIVDGLGGLVRTTRLVADILVGSVTWWGTFHIGTRLATFLTRAFTAEVITATGRVTGLRAVLSGFNPVATAITAVSFGIGVLAAKTLDAAINAKSLKQRYEELYNTLQEGDAKTLQDTIERQNKETSVITEELDKRYRKYLEYVAKVNAASIGVVNQTEEASKRSAQSFRDFMDGLIRHVDDIVKRSREKVRELEQLIEQTTKNITQLQQDAERDKLDRNINKTNDPQQQIALVQAELDRISKLAREQQQIGTLDALQNAEKLFQRERELAVQLFDLRARLLDQLAREDAGLAKQREADQKRILGAQQAANAKERQQIEAQIRLAEKARADLLRRGGGAKPADFRRVEEQIRQLQVKLAQVDEARKKLEATEKQIQNNQNQEKANAEAIATVEERILKAEQARILALKEINRLAQEQIQLAQKQEKEKQAQQEGFGTATKNLLGFKFEVDPNKVFGADPAAIAESAAKVREATLAEFDRLAAEVKKRAEDAKVDPQRLFELDEQLVKRREAIEKELDARLNAAKGQALAQRLAQEKEALDKAAEQAKQVNAETVAAYQENINKLVANLQLLEEQADGLGKRINNQALQDQLRNVRAQLDILKQAGKGTPEQFAIIAKSLGGISTALKEAETRFRTTFGGAGGQLLVEQEAKFVTLRDQVIEVANAYDNVRKANDAYIKAAEQFTGVKTKLEELLKTFEGFKTATNEAKDENKNSQENIRAEVDATILRIKALKDAVEAYRRAAVAAGGANFPGPVPGKMLGGMQYFASGGMARKGLDLQPAMLKRGEFVVQDRAASRYYSQLVAINSNRQPRNFATGGSVQTIGDVTINVNGSNIETPQAMGREIVRSLKRELRLKRSKF